MSAVNLGEVIGAVMRASDCSREVDRNGNAYCEAHWMGWLSDANACVRAESIALAVLAALDLPARDLEVAAEAWDKGWSSGFYKAQARYSDDTEDASEVAVRNPYNPLPDGDSTPTEGAT